MNANRNIIRLDRETASGGFLVRITRKGKLTSQYFRDEDYGGKRKALAAAKEYRDKIEATKKGYSTKELAKRARANNTSGITGVRLVTEVDPRWPSEPEYKYWVAQWSPSKGVRKTKRFSVDKYGDKEAYRLAVKARNRGVANMDS
ncbi:AP2 domain protein [Rubripirellula amarantea]|uniref:AP2 domain protein n=1 Tax=Rubripirellula amarantea TaxID=2527999 RepID=A0A5C5WEI9_9BACT|nr:AP2/ERF family transcription factor [Rubripirellula amarantea]TWT49336.1 AP2 domain protein [Rubripirellula amarantea]